MDNYLRDGGPPRGYYSRRRNSDYITIPRSKIPRRDLPAVRIKDRLAGPLVAGRIVGHMEHFHVRISPDELTFSAAHFITFGHEKCERLHGHNYRVAAEVHGPLDRNHCVVDFITLRDGLRAILGELDHRVLLPADHPSMRINVQDEQVSEVRRPEVSEVRRPEVSEVRRPEVEVTFAGRRWVFPRDDCLLLPVANTTAELLARYLCGRLRDELESCGGIRPALVRIEVEESNGLAAVCELSDR